MQGIIENIWKEYKKQLSESEFSSPLVKSFYFIFNLFQLLMTITGHVRIFMYALGYRAKFKAVVTSWIVLAFALSILLNSFCFSNVIVCFFNSYRIYEIIIINLWMFVFRQGATAECNDSESPPAKPEASIVNRSKR